MVYAGALSTVTIFTDPFAGPASGLLLPGMDTTRDVGEFGGRGRIAGTVKVNSTPPYTVFRRVRLFDKRDGRLVREQWSNPQTGAYSFDYINPSREYVVIAHDHTGVFNAEVRDSVTPEAMP